MRSKIALCLVLLVLPVAVLAAEDDWQLFKRVTDAGRQQPLTGTYLHQMNNTLETFHISRSVIRGQVQERRTALDGLPREIIRIGDNLTCHAPDKKSLMAAKVSAMRLFPALMSEDITDISQSYTLHRTGVGRVAQRDCNWLDLRPRDQMRYTERVCADQASLLPLKLMTLAPNGDVVEQYTFTDISLVPPRDKSLLKPEYKLSSVLRQGPLARLPASDSQALRMEVSGLPAGFRLIRAVQRPLQSGGSNAPVQHMVYSDGLVMLSLFIEPLAESASVALRKPHGMNLHGAVNMATIGHGEQLLTLVGDMPEPMLLALVQGIRIASKS